MVVERKERGLVTLCDKSILLHKAFVLSFFPPPPLAEHHIIIIIIIIIIHCKIDLQLDFGKTTTTMALTTSELPWPAHHTKRYPMAIAETQCGEGGGPLEGLKHATFWTSKSVVKKFFFKKKKLPEVFVALESVWQTGVFSVHILLTIQKQRNMTLVTRRQPHSDVGHLVAATF